MANSQWIEILENVESPCRRRQALDWKEQDDIHIVNEEAVCLFWERQTGCRVDQLAVQKLRQDFAEMHKVDSTLSVTHCLIVLLATESNWNPRGVLNIACILGKLLDFALPVCGVLKDSKLLHRANEMLSALLKYHAPWLASQFSLWKIDYMMDCLIPLLCPWNLPGGLPSPDRVLRVWQVIVCCKQAAACALLALSLIMETAEHTLTMLDADAVRLCLLDKIACVYHGEQRDDVLEALVNKAFDISRCTPQGFAEAWEIEISHLESLDRVSHLPLHGVLTMSAAETMNILLRRAFLRSVTEVMKDEEKLKRSTTLSQWRLKERLGTFMESPFHATDLVDPLEQIPKSLANWETILIDNRSDPNITESGWIVKNAVAFDPAIAEGSEPERKVLARIETVRGKLIGLMCDRGDRRLANRLVFLAFPKIFLIENGFEGLREELNGMSTLYWNQLLEPAKKSIWHTLKATDIGDKLKSALQSTSTEAATTTVKNLWESESVALAAATSNLRKKFGLLFQDGGTSPHTPPAETDFELGDAEDDEEEVVLGSTPTPHYSNVPATPVSMETQNHVDHPSIELIPHVVEGNLEERDAAHQKEEWHDECFTASHEAASDAEEVLEHQPAPIAAEHSFLVPFEISEELAEFERQLEEQAAHRLR